MSAAVDPAVPRAKSGCVECDAAGGWWVHLRRCAACGHVGCCDDSPGPRGRVPEDWMTRLRLRAD